MNVFFLSFLQTEPPKYVPKENEKLAAKYTYKANPSSPIGHELNLKPGAYLKFVRVADCNAHWWYCKNEEGEEGYIPASYVVVILNTVETLLYDPLLSKFSII